MSSILIMGVSIFCPLAVQKLMLSFSFFLNFLLLISLPISILSFTISGLLLQYPPSIDSTIITISFPVRFLLVCTLQFLSVSSRQSLLYSMDRFLISFSLPRPMLFIDLQVIIIKGGRLQEAISVSEGFLSGQEEGLVSLGWRETAPVGPSGQLLILVDFLTQVYLLEQSLDPSLFLQHLIILVFFLPLHVLFQHLLHHELLLPCVLDIPVVHDEMKAGGVADVAVASLDLLLHVHGGPNVMHLGVGPLSSSLNETDNCLEIGWILKDTKVVLQFGLGPYGDISHIGLGQQVEELGDGSGEDVRNLGSPVTNLRKQKLLDPVQDDDERLEDGVAESPEIFSIVHEGNDPRVGLRHNEVVDIEEDGELVHGEVLSYRSVLKLSVHQSVFHRFSLVVFAVEVSGPVDEGNGATGSRCAPNEHVGSSQVVEKSIRIVLRCPCDCDIQDNSELVVGFLEGVIPNVVPQKFLQNLDIKRAALPSRPPKLFEQVQPLLVGKGSEIEGLLIEKFLSCMCGNNRCDDTACTASRNNLWQAIRFDECLHHSDVIHPHDGTPAEQQSAPAHSVSHLSEKLQFLPLRDIRSHNRLKTLGQFFLVLLDQPFGPGVGVAIEEGAIGVGDVSIAVRPDDLYQFESVLLLSGLVHQPHQLLQILVVVVGGVNLIDLRFHIGQLVVLFSESAP